MNSLVSYDWLKDYVALKETPEEFARRMSLSGPAVEKIIPQGENLDGVVLGHIVDVKPHPNADKLRLVTTDIGKKKVTIVCGGSNVCVDQWVAVALVGARVRWHGQGDLITLEPAEIRGVKSDGMICAADEIGLADAFPHEEREILDLGKELGWDAGKKHPNPGTPIADVLGLASDVVMDIEVTTNRVDAMGMVGLAREASAILNRPFTWKPIALPKGGKTPVNVKVSAKKLCPRYMAVRIDGVKIGPSPWWLRRRLMSAGLNSINNIVDITNYVLLELAQPMHAFDAAKVATRLDVRMAKDGEKIRALDGKDYNLDSSMLVIADAERPLAIAGVMGGEESGITEASMSIILEAAVFDPVSIRRTSRKLNLQSDSQLRFEKGLSSEAPPAALARAVELVLEIAGGVVGKVTDVQSEKRRPLAFSISADEVQSLMGVPFPQRDMVAILKRLGFGVTTKGKTIKAVVPWWRDHDIEMARDLVEEIARVHGYGNIPPVIPMDVAPRQMEAELVWEDRVRTIAKGAGLLEAYSYSFVSKDLLAKARYDAASMLHVQNPLSADLEVMRTTLLPSLLDIASENRERTAELRMFEVANVYYPRATDWSDLPDEQLELGAVFTGMKDSWKEAKGFVEHVLEEMGIVSVEWKRLENDAFWHAGRTVQAFQGAQLLATVGEISPAIAAAFKLERVAMIDMPLERVIPLATMRKTYAALPPFPPVKRDLAVVMPAETAFGDVAGTIKAVDPLVSQVQWFDTYRGEHVPDGKKSLAMHLEFASRERTLESAEIDALLVRIQEALAATFGAEVRG